MNLYQQYKEELKDLAYEIKETKPVYKQAQRDRDERASSIIGSRLYVIKNKYRHLHIAMSLVRGKEYEQIEQPRDGNAPNWNIINLYKAELEASMSLELT